MNNVDWHGGSGYAPDTNCSCSQFVMQPRNSSRKIGSPTASGQVASSAAMPAGKAKERFGVEGHFLDTIPVGQLVWLEVPQIYDLHHVSEFTGKL